MNAERIVHGWDGLNFQQLKESEAKALEAEDKLQILDTPQVDGNMLRYRRDFTGYHTRELRAAPAPAPLSPGPGVSAPESEPPAPTVQAVAPPAATAEDVPAVKPRDWRTYKKEVGEALGKPHNKITKAEVEYYLSNQ